MNFLRWLCCCASGACILTLCMAVAFWDCVVMGRSMDEQLDEATK